MSFSKIIICIFIFLFFYNLSCGKETNKAAKEDFFIMYIYPLMTCLPEGSISFPYCCGTSEGASINCNSNIVQSGLIYNAETKEEIGTEILASSNIKLYCRLKEDESALKGGAWYKSPVNNPPPGQKVDFVYAHRANGNIEYDLNGNPTRSKPFTQYAQGDVLYCVMADSSGLANKSRFQKLTIK